MNEYECVGKIDDFQENVGRAVSVKDRMVAVFRKGDSWYAIDDMCPHMGASLAEGYVEGNSVSCPWHAWRFCIVDGTWEDNPRTKIDCFDVKIEDGQVWVREKLPTDDTPASTP
jgi:nitrite reductase (NADH) small subunit/3-phenylpropionate/trans-cinnamate dioxygenase ferredoxin subunit